MARLFTDGAEGNHLYFWDSLSDCVVSTEQKRSGTYSYKISSSNSYATRNLTAALSEFYLRFGFFHSAGTFEILLLRYTTTNIAKLAYDPSTSRIIAYAGNTIVATATVSLATLTWGLVEVYFKMADSGGRIVVRLDDVTIIDYTGDTKPGADTTIDNLMFGSMGTGDAFYIDDLAMNDTSGGSDNSWCGDGYVLTASKPNANGATNQWTLFGAATNYEAVQTANGDTSYVESLTSGHVDEYAMDDVTLGVYTVRRVWVETVARGTGAGASFNIRLTSGASVNDSTAIPLTTAYRRLLSADFLVDPADSAAWNDAKLSAAITGVVRP